MRWIGLVLLEGMSNLPLFFMWFVLPDCRLILVLVAACAFDYDYASLT